MILLFGRFQRRQTENAEHRDVLQQREHIRGGQKAREDEREDGKKGRKNRKYDALLPEAPDSHPGFSYSFFCRRCWRPLVPIASYHRDRRGYGTIRSVVRFLLSGIRLPLLFARGQGLDRGFRFRARSVDRVAGDRDVRRVGARHLVGDGAVFGERIQHDVKRRFCLCGLRPTGRVQHHKEGEAE
jgi:hypothetical protein